MKPHKHAELIKAWADGAEIEYKITGYNGTRWIPLTGNINWFEHDEYRIKPEREFPKSTLTYADMCLAVNTAAMEPSTGEGLATKVARVAADMAVKQYILDEEAKK